MKFRFDFLLPVFCAISLFASPTHAQSPSGHDIAAVRFDTPAQAAKAFNEAGA